MANTNTGPVDGHKKNVRWNFPIAQQWNGKFHKSAADSRRSQQRAKTYSPPKHDSKPSTHNRLSSEYRLDDLSTSKSCNVPSFVSRGRYFTTENDTNNSEWEVLTLGEISLDLDT